jgi:hypothetical protein
MQTQHSSRFSTVRLVILLALLSFGTEREARAYTDPGSGMLIWQMLLAAFAGAMFYFRRVTTWFKNRKGPRE